MCACFPMPTMQARWLAALMLMLAASMMQMAARAYNPFIYFRF